MASLLSEDISVIFRTPRYFEQFKNIVRERRRGKQDQVLGTFDFKAPINAFELLLGVKIERFTSTDTMCIIYFYDNRRASDKNNKRIISNS